MLKIQIWFSVVGQCWLSEFPTHSKAVRELEFKLIWWASKAERRLSLNAFQVCRQTFSVVSSDETTNYLYLWDEAICTGKSKSLRAAPNSLGVE